MKIEELGLGVKLLTPDCHEDERGYFMENYNTKRFADFGLPSKWAQVSQSYTKLQGTIRGLHYQEPQVHKLIWVSKGSIYDAVVDLKTGKHVGVKITADSHQQVLVPPYFAHGFQALEDDVIYHNMMTYEFNPEGDAGLNPLKCGVVWPLEPRNLSDKDRGNPSYEDFISS